MTITNFLHDVVSSLPPGRGSVSPSFQKRHGNLLWKRAHEARESQLLEHIKRTNVFL